MRFWIFMLAVFFFISGVSFSKSSRNQNTLLQQTFEQLFKEPNLTVNVQLKYKERKQDISGFINLNFIRQEDRVAAIAKVHGDLKEMQMDFQGQAKLVDHRFYFILDQSPFGKADEIGQWFVLDPAFLSPLKPAPEKPVHIAFPPELALKLRAAEEVEEKGDEKLNGIKTHHYVVKIKLANLLNALPTLPSQQIPFSNEAFKALSHLKPIVVDLWIGKTDGRLYQANAPIFDVGSLKANINYHVKKSEETFRVPVDPIDGRALGLVPHDLSTKFLESKTKPTEKVVSSLPGTTIDFLPLAPYGGPPLDELKSFCENKFGLKNIVILPEAPLNEQAFNTERRQYTAEELLLSADKTSTPGHYLIAFTDKDVYSKQSPSYAFVSLWGEQNHEILSLARLGSSSMLYLPRSEKLLARSLGYLYWKLPPTSLPEDLMYDSVMNIPDDFDHMGEHFLNDESSPFLEDGISKESQRRYTDAEIAFEKAIQINPVNVKAYMHLAKTESALGKDHETIQVLDKVLLVRGKNDDAFALLGQSYEKLKQPERALWAYRAASLLNPKRSDVLYRESALYGQLGLSEKALEAMQKAKAADKP